MLATQYAEYYKIKPHGTKEDDQTFQRRVASILREKGHLIEAHEVLQDNRYEESEDVMDGVLGAIAQALSDTHYAGDPLGNDQVVGKLVRYQLSDKGQQKKEAKELMAKMLIAGLSPDNLKDVFGIQKK